MQRLENGEIKVLKLKKEDLSNLSVKHRDIITVREYQYGTVTIEGAVNEPGEYSITGETTLKDIIIASGGYKKTAYPFGGFLDNKKTKEINEKARDILYSQYIKSLANNPAIINSESQGLPILMSELKKSIISGRVMAEFDIDMISADPTLDTILMDQDRIMIPHLPNQVYVYGEISNQGAIRYSPGKGVNYYLKNAGNILETGDKKTIFVVHPNGNTERLSSNFRIFNNQNNKILIYPGSIIYVPHAGNSMRGIQAASIWAPIISSIALSLTSLSVISND